MTCLMWPVLSSRTFQVQGITQQHPCFASDTEWQPSTGAAMPPWRSCAFTDLQGCLNSSWYGMGCCYAQFFKRHARSHADEGLACCQQVLGACVMRHPVCM